MHRREADTTITSVTTTMVQAVTVDARPTAQALMTAADDGSVNKGPAKENGAPVGNGSPAVKPPPPQNAVAVAALIQPCQLIILSEVLLAATLV